MYRGQKHQGKLLNYVQLGYFAKHHVFFLEYIYSLFQCVAVMNQSVVYVSCKAPRSRPVISGPGRSARRAAGTR